MLDTLTAFSLIAVVLTVSALAAGLVDRAPLSFPMIFLAVGFIVGPLGLGIVVVTPRDPYLQTLATISLAFVLFLDAVRVRFDSSSRGWTVPILDLGPGTIITLVGIALCALVIFGATPLQALLLGAILSSTDPIVLRDIVRDERLPHAVREALSIEAGTNDLVVLPILFVLLAVMTGHHGSLSDWVTFLVALLVVGPLVGALVGGIGSGVMAFVDARYPVRSELSPLGPNQAMNACAARLMGLPWSTTLMASGLATP
ncbi:MAG TPA: cation:proton antiporter, partial [Chloroflexota bacterium]|nr:cation:proton antiporter [Chloroflexota bacterium]